MRYSDQINGLKYAVVEVDGGKCRTPRGMFLELDNLLHFPQYDHTSSAIMDDYMTDLQWLPEKNYLIVVKNTAKLRKDSDSYNDVETRLANYKSYWDNKRVQEGRDWENHFDFQFVP